MAKIEIPSFEKKDDLFKWLIENKDIHIQKKLSEVKHADAVPVISMPAPGSQTAVSKALTVSKEEGENPDPNKMQVKAVINTTNLMDSHNDVHIPGLWKKSLKENQRILFLQEHRMDFKYLISRNLKAKTEVMSFKELGYPSLKMNTEALIFDAEVERKTNEMMFDLYKDGDVDNHSVGMKYVKIALAINSEDYPAENEVWEKYISEIANKEVAESKGFFWAVTEAKVFEGSAVLAGSNYVTPTLSTETKSTEPPQSTQDGEPSKDTRKFLL